MLPLVVVPQLPRSSLEEEVRTLRYVDSEKRFQNVLEACGVFKSRETWCKRRRQSDCWIDSAKGPEWK
ncbi:hypothetical protein P8452_36864 [Trifolium repens]|nr:hypothetical protein P8452_36864 [Trifolium repens]